MNPKIEKLQEEHERNDAKIEVYRKQKAQCEHQIEREESRQRYLSEKANKRRTHHLCNLGGTVEHFFPITKVLTRAEMYTVFEKLSEFPEVQNLFLSLHPQNGGDCLSHSTTFM